MKRWLKFKLFWKDLLYLSILNEQRSKTVGTGFGINEACIFEQKSCHVAIVLPENGDVDAAWGVRVLSLTQGKELRGQAS